MNSQNSRKIIEKKDDLNCYTDEESVNGNIKLASGTRNSRAGKAQTTLGNQTMNDEEM